MSNNKIIRHNNLISYLRHKLPNHSIDSSKIDVVFKGTPVTEYKNGTIFAQSFMYGDGKQRVMIFDGTQVFDSNNQEEII